MKHRLQVLNQSYNVEQRNHLKKEEHVLVVVTNYYHS